MTTQTIETIAAGLYVALVAGLLVALLRMGILLFIILMFGVSFLVSLFQSLAIQAINNGKKASPQWVIEVNLGLIALFALVYSMSA